MIHSGLEINLSFALFCRFYSNEFKPVKSISAKHQAEAYSGFYCTEQLGAFLLPRWIVRITPSIEKVDLDSKAPAIQP